MKIQKAQFLGYEAFAYIGVGSTKVGFIGFGDTHKEAMMMCLNRIKNFLNPNVRV